jgi:hypothetical protein
MQEATTRPDAETHIMDHVAKRSRNAPRTTSSALPTKIEAARDRALSFIVEQRIDASKSTDGRALGIQAKLSRSLDGDNAIALEEFVPGVSLDPTTTPKPDDSLNGVWLGIVAKVCQMLGFPLEPELFSNMLVVAQLAGVEHPTAERLANDLAAHYRDSSVDGLYHFFSSLRFACDIDCTAVGVRSRLALGDLHIDDAVSRAALRRSTGRILGSAAVADVPREANRSHGKENGPLQRLVFKVYLDDHTVQPAELDRGLKQDAVVVANALWPVLAELTAGLRQQDEPIALREFAEGGAEPRLGVALTHEIVAANVEYVIDHLRSGAWRQGTRYYVSPDSFLCAFSELTREFLGDADVVELLGRAIEERRRDAKESDPIDVAMRGIAAANAGLDPSAEQKQLIDTQLPGGGWPGFGALYSAGTLNAPRMYFGSAGVTAAFAARALSPVPRRFFDAVRPPSRPRLRRG